MAQQEKFMSVKEFYEKGYLQELNRQFLHPLGLALEVATDEDDEGNEKHESIRLGRIWDNRENDEGMIFDDSVTCTPEFKQKAGFIKHEFQKRLTARIRSLGTLIQRVPEE